VQVGKTRTSNFGNQGFSITILEFASLKHNKRNVKEAMFEVNPTTFGTESIF